MNLRNKSVSQNDLVGALGRVLMIITDTVLYLVLMKILGSEKLVK